MAQTTDQLLEKLEHHPLPNIDLGLERVRMFLARLGHPEERLPPVVHIAGSNGKGSVLAFLDAMLHAAGYRVHRYTSPHLVHFHERIRLGGAPIADDTLRPLLAQVLEASRDFPLTYFESTTAAAFLAFAQNPADILLLEVGLGGRLDATNVIPSTRLCVITPVSLEHTDYLGETLEQIAGEKAGILQAGVPCVVGPQATESLRTIEERAAALGVPLSCCDRDWQVHSHSGSFDYRSIAFDDGLAQRGITGTLLPLQGGADETRCKAPQASRGGGGLPPPTESADASSTPPQGGSRACSLEELRSSLPGRHQHANAAMAIACVEQLVEFDVPEAAIREGIRSARWPGRLQRLTSGPLVAPLPESTRLWVDGGHNPAAAAALADWCRTQQRRVHVILGMRREKDAAGFLTPLAPYLASLHTITIPGDSGSVPAEELAAAARVLGLTARPATSLHQAVAHCMEQGEAQDILMTGSLYLAGVALAESGSNCGG